MSKASLVENNRKGEGNMKLEIFRNAEFGEVRTIVGEDGEPWFMLADVCRVLDIKNPRDAKSRLNRSGVDSTDVTLIYGYSSDGTPKYRESKATFINESNLYKLVFQSRKPQAERFADWVTSEVLPSIRKTGSYGLPQISEKERLVLQLHSGDDFLVAQAHKQLVELEKQPLLETIEVLEPKAKYTDTILQNNSLVNISQIAKDYGMSGQALNKKLNELKVQYKQGGQWLLYSKYQDKGYTHSKTSNLYDTVGIDKVVMSTKWTQKGRLFLYELLKKNGIIPVVER